MMALLTQQAGAHRLCGPSFLHFVLPSKPNRSLGKALGFGGCGTSLAIQCPDPGACAAADLSGLVAVPAVVAFFTVTQRDLLPSRTRPASGSPESLRSGHLKNCCAVRCR